MFLSDVESAVGHPVPGASPAFRDPGGFTVLDSNYRNDPSTS
jgi:hypothetical protein